MNFEMITEGLKQLLQENNYSSATIRFYEGEWNKIQCFLTEEYGNTEYDMERGLKISRKNNTASLRNIIMERFPNRESNCSVLCICWKITVCIRCLPEDTMPQKILLR